MSTDVSDENAASIFRVEELATQETSMKPSCACYLPHGGFLLGLSFNPEDGGDMFLRNVS
jgi:hypothetical protein